MKKSEGKISSTGRREKIRKWGKEKAHVRFFFPLILFPLCSLVQGR